MCFEWPDATPGPSHVEMIDDHEENYLAPPAVHPGEHLAIDLKELKELKISAARLARQRDVPTNRIPEILNRNPAITGDTALHLAHFFGTTAEFWLNLQSLYQIRIAERKLGRSIQTLPTLKHQQASA